MTATLTARHHKRNDLPEFPRQEKQHHSVMRVTQLSSIAFGDNGISTKKLSSTLDFGILDGFINPSEGDIVLHSEKGSLPQGFYKISERPVIQSSNTKSFIACAHGIAGSGNDENEAIENLEAGLKREGLLPTLPSHG